MNTTLFPLAEIFRMNTGLLCNCLVGMTDEQARCRVGSRTNSAGFIVLHVIDARHHLAQLLGLDTVNPYAERSASVHMPEDIATLPPLDEMTAEWDKVSTAVMDALQHADEQDLIKSSPKRFPINDESMLGAIAFFAQHESYHLGQLGFLRKELGLGRMRWGKSE